MSGFEVVGVVLGGFPLLVSALEHWQSGARMLQNWWQFEREYQKSLMDINHQQLIFRQNLEECLLPLVADDDQVELLLADPTGPGWSVPEPKEKLEKRLSKPAYEQYKETVAAMKVVMNELQGMAKKVQPEHMLPNKVENAFLSILLILNETTIGVSKDYEKTKEN